jgi:DNA (cytosine-5)-methyltransferase 1
LLRFYDFFAGAGLATCGLSHAWQCVWANDIDLKKAEVYKANFGPEHFHVGDVSQFAASDLPNSTQMAWASFPCQDLSLAGWRRGLSDERSGAFWPFWRILRTQLETGARPPVIVLENVLGLLYGGNFEGLCEALAALGMQFGGLVIDAQRFLPQSRPRVFMVAVDARVNCADLTADVPVPEWTPGALVRAQAALPSHLQTRWRWWQAPTPNVRVPSLKRIIEPNPTAVEWHTPKETRYLVSLMNRNHLDKVAEAKRRGGLQVGFVYKRIRDGKQRAEVRFDGIAGCLRTPGGGSSRQTVLLVENGEIRSRLLSPREAARLMGAPDSFKLPKKYNDAYKAMGDAVAAPVVHWLSTQLLEELARRGTELPHGNYVSDELLLHVAERASEWIVEKRRTAAKDIFESALVVVEQWRNAWHTENAAASDCLIACAGIKVAETSRKKWPILREDLVSAAGRFRCTGRLIKTVLQKRFREERRFAIDGGLMTGAYTAASEHLAQKMSAITGYAGAQAEERNAVADAIEQYLYENVVRPRLDAEGISIPINFATSPRNIVSDLLNAGAGRGLSGAVAQHLVGAKLALRFPALEIDNHSYDTKDQRRGSPGDFIVGHTVFHVTMSPGIAVVERCEHNLANHLQPVLLVPREQRQRATELVGRSSHFDRISVTTIEEFIAEDVAETGQSGNSGVRQGIKRLIGKYNDRVEHADEKCSLRIIPPQL